jgi:hypothetical protein
MRAGLLDEMLFSVRLRADVFIAPRVTWTGAVNVKKHAMNNLIVTSKSKEKINVIG